MDDGSGSTGESIDMLKALHSQGVSTVVMTSHFYPHEESPAEFMTRRNACIESLLSAISEENLGADALPDIYLGAEVAYFSGISGCEPIKSLCVEGTRLLLVEMPFGRWSSSVVDEICQMEYRIGVRPVIAHIERYLAFKNENQITKLIAKGVVVQFNANSFLRIGMRRKVIKLMKQGYLNVIGSDCHNMTNRAPRMSDAFRVIEERMGVSVVGAIVETSHALLSNAKKCLYYDA